MYRVSEEEMRLSQVEYKKRYPAFRPFLMGEEAAGRVVAHFANLVVTQNGQDTDDYLIADNNKVERYISGLPAGSDVLLLGTGTGREVLVAKDLGYRAVGTTLGSRNVDFGVQSLGLDPSELRECLNEALPFRSDTFDFVAGFQVFEHTISPLTFLLEQARVLKLGGKLMLEWPPAKDYSMDDNPHHQVCFTPGQALMLFKKAGFEDIKLFYDDLSPIPEEDWWRGDQNKMLCIEGTRGDCRKNYVLQARNF